MSAETQYPLRKVVHDLRGPLLTIRGFTEELKNDLQDFADVTLASPLDQADLAQALNDDMQPCISYILQAVAQLENRLNTISTDPDQCKPS